MRMSASKRSEGLTGGCSPMVTYVSFPWPLRRSEEHTSELQSLTNLVCRLLLEKNKILHNARAHLLLPTPVAPVAIRSVTQGVPCVPWDVLFIPTAVHLDVHFH